MVKVVITCKKLLNITYKTVKYQLLESVLSNVLIFFTKKGYTEEFLTFIRTEQRRSNVLTSARNQPFCRKYTNIGCFDGTRINPRNLTEKNTSLFIYNNPFC